MLKEIAPHVTNAALLGNRKASVAGRYSFLSGRASGAGPRQAIPSERNLDRLDSLAESQKSGSAGSKTRRRGRLGQVGNPARAVALFTWTATAPSPSPSMSPFKSSAPNAELFLCFAE